MRGGISRLGLTSFLRATVFARVSGFVSATRRGQVALEGTRQRDFSQQPASLVSDNGHESDPV